LAECVQDKLLADAEEAPNGLSNVQWAPESLAAASKGGERFGGRLVKSDFDLMRIEVPVDAERSRLQSGPDIVSSDEQVLPVGEAQQRGKGLLCLILLEVDRESLG
jgi:hypothetical protein